MAVETKNGWIFAVRQLDTGLTTITADDITDASVVGKDVLTAADAAAVRTAIGTVAASTATAGIVKQITFTAQQSPDFADLAAVTVAYNALLTKLITAGIMPAA